MSDDAMSAYLADKLLDHVLRATAYPCPAGTWAALFTSGSGLAENAPASEVSGGGYARLATAFSQASDGHASNTGAIEFPVAASGWGTVTHIAVMDAAVGGNVLFWKELAGRSYYAMDRCSIPAGGLSVSLAGEISAYLADKLLDHVLRATAYPCPAGVWAGLFCSHEGLADNLPASRQEAPSGGGYERMGLTGGPSPVMGAGCGGLSLSEISLMWPTATADWGGPDWITHAALLDAGEPGAGNVLFFHGATVHKRIWNGDFYEIEAGSLRVGMS